MQPAIGAPHPNGQLRALQPRALVRLRGAAYVLERSLRLAQGDRRWTEHRLSSDESGRSVWLEVPDEAGGELLVHERGYQLPPLSGPIVLDAPADGFTLRRAGTARYRTVERAGLAKTGSLSYVEYASGDRRMTFERHRQDEPWQLWHGHVIDRAAVRLV
jgi:hypothetical protein